MITYRRPHLDEAEIFAALHVQCWREAYRDIVPAELMAKYKIKTRLPMWESILPDQQRIVFGAYDQGYAVGFIVAGEAIEELFNDIDGHVAALYIAASHYRRGIGRTLMGLAAKAWFAEGGHALALGVLAENKPARSFYEVLGGKLIKTGTYEWDSFPLADAIYNFDDLPALFGKD